MIISKRLEDAEFIMSKDELTYSAVIEDFKNASQIHILTYNISKCYAEAYDEKLDYYVDKAISAASNVFAELAEEAKDEADMLLRQIEELETLAKKVLKLFKSLPLNDIRIDNTKK